MMQQPHHVSRWIGRLSWDGSERRLSRYTEQTERTRSDRGGGVKDREPHHLDICISS